jgi:DNA-binding PadR family transcriptional regulator
LSNSQWIYLKSKYGVYKLEAKTQLGEKPTDPQEAEFNKIKEKLTRRTITNFLDLIIIRHFQKKPFSGYDATKFINKQFNIVLSPGTVYSTLHAMERDGMLESAMRNNKTVFKATVKGLQVDRLLESSDQIVAFLKYLIGK